MKPTPANLKRAVAKLGGTVEDVESGRYRTLHLDAPLGMVWSCDDLHCLVCEWRPGEKGYADAAIADALERIAYGVEPCEEADCDICEERRTGVEIGP